MSKEQLSSTARLGMAVVTLVFGLFTVFVGPFIIQIANEAVLNVVILESGPPPSMYFYTAFVVPMFFYFYRAIGVIGGIACILVAFYLWKGESWAWPVAVVSISLPTIFTVLTIIPYMAHVGGMPPTIYNIIFGMVVYWIVLLFPRSDKREKAARLSVFTLLGLLCGEVAVFCMQGTKALAGMGEMAYTTENPGVLLADGIKIFGFSWPLQIATVIMSVFAIYLLAKRDRRGYGLAMMAGVTAMIANFTTQIIRMVTIDFLFAGILGLLLVISLLVPGFKDRLIGERE